MAKVLCIDDDDSVAKLVAKLVKFCGHTPVVLTYSMDAIVYLHDFAVKAVITDYMMPKLDGIDLLVAFMDARPNVRRFLITAAPDERAVKEALASGIVREVMKKPPGIPDMEEALRHLDDVQG